MHQHVDQAWERFRQRVKDEPIPEVWTRLMQSETGDNGVATSMPFTQRLTVAETMVDSEANAHLRASAGSTALRKTEHWGEQVLDAANSRTSARNRFRRKWLMRGMSGVAVGAMGVFLFATSPGEKVIAAAMQTFYIQHLVGVSAGDLQSIENAFSFAGQPVQSINLQQFGTLEVKSSANSPLQPVSIAKAEQLSGYPQLPQLPQSPGIHPPGPLTNFMPQQQATFRLNVTNINRFIWQMGGKATFPASANGVPIVLTIPPRVTMNVNLGKSGFESLTVMRVPEVQVPPDVNLDAVRKALVTLPFLPLDIKNSLLAGDWKQTLWIPEGQGGQTVRLGDREVLLDLNRYQSTATWLANGYLYNLNGTFSTQASILSTVKEISP